MKSGRKEDVQYVTAIVTLFTGILMCFLSFFLNEYIIDNSVLMYFGEALIFCAAVFGVNVLIKNKVLEAESRLKKEIEDKIG